MVRAANAVFLVSTQKERGPTMSAELIDEANTPIGISEGEEALSENFDTDLRPIRLGDL
jgi:hypothetical protein